MLVMGASHLVTGGGHNERGASVLCIATDREVLWNAQSCQGTEGTLGLGTTMTAATTEGLAEQGLDAFSHGSQRASNLSPSRCLNLTCRSSSDKSKHQLLGPHIRIS